MDAKPPHENIIVEERKRDTSKIRIIFLLSCQFCVCICVYMHVLLSHIYLDLLSGQTALKLHLAAPYKAGQNREPKLLLTLEIQVGIPIFLSPYFNFFHCHMRAYKLISPLQTGPSTYMWISTSEVTVRQTHGIFSSWGRCIDSS